MTQASGLFTNVRFVSTDDSLYSDPGTDVRIRSLKHSVSVEIADEAARSQTQTLIPSQGRALIRRESVATDVLCRACVYECHAKK